MHFSKTYTQLLLSLPPELRENAIEYRKLKKLINQVVQELTQLGLSPDVLQQVLLESKASHSNGKEKGKETEPSSWLPISSSQDTPGSLPRVVYEINTDSDRLEPRLRLLVDSSEDRLSTIPLPVLTALEQEYGNGTPDSTPDEDGPSELGPVKDSSFSGVTDEDETMTIDGSSSQREEITEISTKPSSPQPTPSHGQEVIIPLPSDTVFFQVLMQALQTLSTQLGAVSDEFVENLHELSRAIASTAKPMSATSSSFTAHSHDTHPATISVPSNSSLIPFGHNRQSKSDLYQWREIFQLYVDTEVFESHSEKSRGERNVEDAEQRLELFRQRLQERGYNGGHALRLKESRDSLEKFMRLNMFILDLKKFQFATTEATRKILKKHAKRTALSVDPSLTSLFTLQNPGPHGSDPASSLVLAPRNGTSLSLMLVQALGETLLPIIPHIDDYACVICTSIAFKPIRLQCGHLFCVRCLVKMQKRGKGNCPMCRAPTVLSADRTNVDWALLNFMKDWFPIEARQKLQQNEREATEEHMRELGYPPDGPGCIVM